MQSQAFSIGIIMMKVLVWSNTYHGGWFDVIKLVTIGLAIDLTFISLIDPLGNLLHLWITRLCHWRFIQTCYFSHRSDIHKSDLFSRQFTSIMSCTFNFTIYLRLDAVMTAGPFSHKSRFICHFRTKAILRRIILW